MPKKNPNANGLHFQSNQPNPNTYSGMNPYSGVDPMQQLSGWNKFTDFLGLTNHAGNMQYAHNLNANMWQSEYNLALQDRQYNSESAVAERMRQAGLNPDLQSVQGGESSLAGNPASAPQVPQHNLNSFTTALSSMFNTIIGVASGVSQINLANSQADFSIFDSVFNKWKNDSVNLALSADDPSKLLSILSSAYTSGNRELIRNIPLVKFTSPFRTKRANRLMQDFQENYLYNDGFRQDVIKALGSNFDDVLKSSRSASQIDSLVAGTNSDLRQVLAVLSNAEVNLWRKRQKLEDKRLDKDTTYQETYNPQLHAEAFNADNEEAKAELNMRLNLKSVEREMVEKLAKLADKGNVLSQAALIAFSQFNNFDVNVNSSSSQTPWGNFKSSSSSFGFK